MSVDNICRGHLLAALGYLVSMLMQDLSALEHSMQWSAEIMSLKWDPAHSQKRTVPQTMGS